MSKFINFYWPELDSKKALKEAITQIFWANSVQSCEDLNEVKDGVRFVFSHLPLILSWAKALLETTIWDKFTAEDVEKLINKLKDVYWFRCEWCMCPADLPSLEKMVVWEDEDDEECCWWDSNCCEKKEETAIEALERLSEWYFKLSKDWFSILQDWVKTSWYKYDKKSDTIIDFTSKWRPSWGANSIRNSFDK